MPHRYVFRVDFDDDSMREQFIEHWRKGSALIQKLPGSRGTKLHSMHGSSSVMAIAEWDSKELRDAAMKELHQGNSEVSKQWLAMPKNEDFGKVMLLGEIDEIGFMPPNHEASIPSTGAFEK
jgi:hypothetical protein